MTGETIALEARNGRELYERACANRALLSSFCRRYNEAVNIQTAGMSGTTGAEESLEGLENVQEVYDLVAAELRRFRGSMTPTAADVEAGPADTLSAILAELRAIRQALEEQ